MAAQRGEIGGDGGAAVLVGDGVVLVAAGGAVAAAGADAGAVAGLGVAAQCGAGESVIGVGVEVAPVPFAVLLCDVREDPGPGPDRTVAVGQLGEECGGNVQLDGSAAGTGGGKAGGAATGGAVEQQSPGRVGDRVAPLRAALGGDDGAGVSGRDG